MPVDGVTGRELPELLDPSRRRPVGEDLRRIWSRRDFIWFAAISDVRNQQIDTVFGNIWHLLNPALQISVYFVVFGLILGTDRGVDNFLPFLAIGIFTFGYMRTVIVLGATSLTKHSGLIRSMSFPRAVLPLSVGVTATVGFVFQFVIMLVVAAATGETPSVRWLMTIPIFGGQALFALGMAFVAARITFSFRDFENILQFLFRMAFYFSGVLFYVEKFVHNPTARQIADLNPLLDFITLHRWAVMGLPVSTTALVSSVVWSLGGLVLGYLWFQRREPDYGRE